MEDGIGLMLPWFVLAGGVLFTMLVSVIRVESRRPAQMSAVLVLLATAYAALSGTPPSPTLLFHSMFEVSTLTLSVLAALSFTALLFVLGTTEYLDREKLHISDYYPLLLILVLGGSVLAASRDLIVSFIALEVMSLPAYTLAGFRRNDSRSNEAALKYFILGGAMGAVFLLGASFIFGATGTTQLGAIYEWSKAVAEVPALFMVGHLLVLSAFLFKVAAVPFHFWKPDVYEGAPVPVTGIMATIVTGASFVTLVRLIQIPDFNGAAWVDYFTAVKAGIRIAAAGSLLVGSLVIITQKNLKRMMAYSSISHTGYLLLGALGLFAHPGEIYPVLIYLAGYLLMGCGLFVLMSLSRSQADAALELVDLTGLLKRSPALTGVWVVFLFSMAGMPFTIGFFTKYVVFMSSIGAGEVPLVVIAALCTVVSAYAYLRPIALMVMRDADPGASEWRFNIGSQIVAVSAATGVLFLGIMPNGVIQYLKGIMLIH
jgi:NADH-quinone oxidoreductase subunit N